MPEGMSNDFVMQLQIELGEGRQQIQKLYELISNTFSKPIEVTVTGRPDFGAVIAEAGQVARAIEGIGTAASETTRQLEATKQKGVQAAKQIQDTMARGDVKADIFEALHKQEELNKKIKALDAERLREKKKKVKEGIGVEIQAAQEELQAIEKTIGKLSGSKHEATNKAVRAAITEYAELRMAIDQARNAVDSLKTSQGEVTKGAKRVTAEAGQGFGNLKIGIDKEFFKFSILNAIREVEGAGLTVKVGAKGATMKPVLAAAPDIKQAVAAAVTEVLKGPAKDEVALAKAQQKNREIASTRSNMSTAIKTGGAMDVLQSLGFSGDQLANAQAIHNFHQQKMKDPRSVTEKDVQAAFAAIPQFMRDLNSLKGDNVAAARRAFGSSWNTPTIDMASRLGMSAAAKNIRDANKPQYSPDEYVQKHLVPFQNSMRSFAGERPDFLANRWDRNVYKEQVNSYNDILKMLRQIEEQSLRFQRAKSAFDAKQDAVTERALKRELDKLNTMRQELSVQEQHFRMNALIGQRVDATQFSAVTDERGRVKLATQGLQTLDKSQAYSNSRGLMEMAFAGTYSKYLSNNEAERNKHNSLGTPEGARKAASVNDLSFDQFLQQQFAGNTALNKLYLEQLGYSNKVLASETSRGMVLRGLLAPLSQIHNQYQKITLDIEKEVANLRLIERFEAARDHRLRNPMGYSRAARGMSYTFGGVAVGMAAGTAVMRGFHEYRQLEQELADIQGVLNASKGNVALVADGISASAKKYGMDLVQTAQAAKLFAETGMKANQIIKELDVTMMGARGLGMTIQQMQELQIVTNQIMGAGHSLEVLDKIAKVSAEYAVTPQNLADAIRIASPVMEQYAQNIQGIGTAMDYTAAMATVMIERLRMSGSEAGNALKFMMARIVTPGVLKHAQDDYGLKMGANPKEFLQLPDLMAAIHDRWREIQKDDPAKATQFLVQMAGGRRVNALIALLEEYEKMQKIATTSMGAFGDAERRAATANDTLNVSLLKLKDNFRLFLNNMVSGTGIAGGLKVAVDGLAGALGGLDGRGAGTAGLLGMIAGGGLAVRGGQKAYQWMQAAQYLGPEAGAYMAAKKIHKARELQTIMTGAATSGASALPTAEFLGGVGLEAAIGGGVAAGTAGKLGMFARIGTKLSGVFATLAEVFTPAGVLLGGLVLFISTLGALSRLFHWLNKSAEGTVHIRTADELEIWKNPKYKEFKDFSKGFGFAGPEKAFDAASQGMNSKGFLEVMDRISKGGKELRNDAVDEFIKGMGKAGEAIDKIPDKEERAAAAMKLVGYASWSASAIIVAGLEDISRASGEVVDKALDGINRVDKAKRTSWLQKFSGTVGDVLKNRTPWQSAIDTKETSNSAGGVVSSYQQLMKVISGTGMDQSMLSTFTGRSFMDAVNKAGTEFHGKVHNAADLFVAAYDKLSDKQREDMVDRGARSLLQKLNGGLAQIETEGNALGYAGGDSVQKMHTIMSDIMNKVRSRVDELAESALYKENPQAKQFFDVYKKMLDTGPPKFFLGLEKTTEGLGRFKDALLNFTVDILRQMKQMELERSFAGKYGLAYDDLDEKEKLAKDMYMRPKMMQIDALKEMLDARKSAVMSAQQANLPEGTIEDFTRGSLGAGQVAALEAVVNKGGKGRFETLKNLQASYSRIYEDGEKLAEVFGHTPEGKKLKNMFEELLGKLVSGAITEMDINAAYEYASAGIMSPTMAARKYRMGVEVLRANSTANLDIQGQLLEKRLDTVPDMARAFGLRQAQAGAGFEDRRYGAMEEWEKNRDVLALERKFQEIDLEETRNKNQAVRLAQLEAENALIKQGNENMRAFTGAWAGVLKNPKLMKMNGRQILQEGFGPGTQHMYGRYVDNMFGDIEKRASQNPTLAKLFQSPEGNLKNAVITAYELGSVKTYNAIVSAFIAGNNYLTTGVTPDLKKVPNGKDVKMGKVDYLNTIGMMAGSMVGAKASGGGAGAQTGAAMGSMVLGGIGTAMGALGGPLGSMVGGLLGGIIGKALFGDKPEVQSATISSLDSIERAQRDTITAIQNQTDALLKPENRFLNLPSNFTVPNYNPGTGAGIQINIDARGNPNAGAIGQHVEDAISNALYNNRRGRALDRNIL